MVKEVVSGVGKKLAERIITELRIFAKKNQIKCIISRFKFVKKNV
jgi:Holliday junction resolvasome RuvABC DNA-binding subunit